MSWLPEAVPQTEAELWKVPCCPEVVDAAGEIDICSIVHFTRVQPGLVGILASSAIKARLDLPDTDRLRHIYEENAVNRSRDREWHGYVNLSITDINKWMFRSSKKWHPEAEWVILEFRPVILGDPGVVFCTTNNAYPTVRRHAGLRGFNQMFDSAIPGYEGRISTRSGCQPNQTTDHQAEVLYPFSLSLDHLQSIIVGDKDTRETVWAILNSFPELPSFPSHNPDSITVKPKAFR